MEKIDIKSLNIDELTIELKKFDFPNFKARQVFSWLHKKGVMSFEEMTDISKKHRDILESNF